MNEILKGCLKVVFKMLTYGVVIRIALAFVDISVASAWSARVRAAVTSFLQTGEVSGTKF